MTGKLFFIFISKIYVKKCYEILLMILNNTVTGTINIYRQM